MALVFVLLMTARLLDLCGHDRRRCSLWLSRSAEHSGVSLRRKHRNIADRSQPRIEWVVPHARGGATATSIEGTDRTASTRRDRRGPAFLRSGSVRRRWGTSSPGRPVIPDQAGAHRSALRRHPDIDRRACGRRRLHPHRSPHQAQPLPHADEAQTGPGLEPTRVEPDAVVGDRESNARVVARQVDAGRTRQEYCECLSPGGYSTMRKEERDGSPPLLRVDSRGRGVRRASARGRSIILTGGVLISSNVLNPGGRFGSIGRTYRRQPMLRRNPLPSCDPILPSGNESVQRIRGRTMTRSGDAGACVSR
jgi:hypothetical protein